MLVSRRKEKSFTVSLDVSHVQFVRDALRASHFTDADWFNLGSELDLPYAQLKIIEDSYKSDPTRCLRECLSLWLTSASAHRRNWSMLTHALKKMNQSAVAEKISETYESPASQLVQCHINELSQLQLSEQSVDLLGTAEGLIPLQTRTEVENFGGFLADAIREICISVAKDSENLKALGMIVLESDPVLGNKLLKGYTEIISKGSSSTRNYNPSLEVPNVLSVDHALAAQTVEKVFVSEVYSCQFDEVQVKFGDLLHNIVLIVTDKISSVDDDIKQYVQRCCPGLSDELATVTSVAGIMSAVEKRCNVINIAPLKRIVKRYNITEAEELIDEYQKAVEVFCSEIRLDTMIDKKISLVANSDDCEMLEFILEWEPDKYSLDDIRLLLKKAFYDNLKKRIIVSSIHEGHSVKIICYVPRHLLDALLLEAQNNLNSLTKGFSLKQMTIGQFVVMSLKTRELELSNLTEDVKLLCEEAQSLSSIEKDKKRILLQHEYGLEHLHKLKDSELKMTLVSRLELTKTILKTKSFDIEHFQTSLAMKQERRKETLMAKREAEFLQWKIPLMKKIAKEKVVYIAQLDYPGYGTYSISFFKNERIEIIETDDSIWWKGKSMDSGCEGFVPSSYVRSNLESIELFQYAMEDQHVPVPCIKELKSQLLTEDEKASLFLQSIDEDPMLLHALREAKKLKKEKITGKINWSSDSLSLYNLSASQCKEAIVMLSSGKYHTIALSRLSPESVLSLLPHILQENKSVSLYIWNTPLTHDCVLCLCDLMAASTSLKELIIRYSSVSDKGMACICKSLHHNSALTDFFVISNPHVTSISGQAFSELLLNNSKLTHLKVKWNMLPPKSLKLILQSLRVNKSLQKFTIDERSYEALVTNHTRKMDKRLTCD